MWGLPWWSSGKTLCFHARDLGLIPCWGIKIPYAAQHSKKQSNKQTNGEERMCSRKPGKSHVRRGLVGCSPWGR